MSIIDANLPPIAPSAISSADVESATYGRVVHIIVPPNPTTESTSKTNPALLKPLARKPDWRKCAERTVGVI